MAKKKELEIVKTDKVDSKELDLHSRWICPAYIVFPREEGQKVLDSKGRQWRLIRSNFDGFLLWQQYHMKPLTNPDPKHSVWYNSSHLPQEVLDQYVTFRSEVLK